MIRKTLNTLLFLCLTLQGYCQLQGELLTIRLFINNKPILDDGLRMGIILNESNHFIKANYLDKATSDFTRDSSYIFNLVTIDKLLVPYTYLIVFYKDKMYEVPLDRYYTNMEKAPTEFRKRTILNIEITDLKKIDKYFGVFRYSISSGGAEISEAFFSTKKDPKYYRILNSIIK